MNRILVVIAASVLVAMAAHPEGGAEDAESALAPSIAAVELDKRREAGDAPVVIDVRTPEEYASGHIPGAVNIPFDQVAGRIDEIDAPHGVALYCMVGPRSRKGESALLASGYEKVLHLEGGLAAWIPWPTPM